MYVFKLSESYLYFECDKTRFGFQKWIFMANFLFPLSGLFKKCKHKKFYLGTPTECMIFGVEIVKFALDLGGGQGTPFVTDAVYHSLVRHYVLASSLKRYTQVIIVINNTTYVTEYKSY